MTDSPEIDFDHLNQYVGDDPDLTREVFGLFRNQVEMWGRGLHPDADDEVWASVTHSLKGSARAVGAMGLADACERAEALIGDDRRPGGREVAVQTLEHRIETVLAEIARWEYRDDMNRLRKGEVR
jgi:HPt (histidine-containing phosphotransfer) domain-containing protein